MARASGSAASNSTAKGTLATGAKAPAPATESSASPRRGPVRGLTFERRWTTPGVHPYDEVAWATRTASIGNESGKVVFEQTDVEVPESWSQLATNVVVSKYFRGHLGTAERERSVKQLISRVVDTICGWAEQGEYFATAGDLETFRAELTHLILHQKMSFNSPVWFNVGVEEHPQCSACFINSVQDTMPSIMELAKTEAMLFKYGSGAGSNLSPLRSSREKMAGGGIASGPVSFMKGYDAFAGVIKSGGKTRRAAKMVILDVDHPDILEFINCKMLEEKKAWALIEAGYDPSFTGEAYASVFFQNANHSVRVTDDYMRAVERDGEWTTHFVTNGEAAETHRAREIMRQIAEAAWVCGDPGMQYDTTINDWNPVANSDRQVATNPCSEFSFINDTSCNLASLNLMKFVREDGEFDVEAYRYACRLTIAAQEIVVDYASYPTPKIEENSHRFRPLGLGYANLGALLMSRGLAYDSDGGRAFAGALTSIMTAEAYRQSAVIARDHGGPFVEYGKNREPFLRVIRKHRDAAQQMPAVSVPEDLHTTARDLWDETLALGEEFGYRNAQVTLLAPTGTIAFMMDCDTTGIEPDIALVKYKKLVGEGFLKIVNQTVPAALRKLGYDSRQVEEIVRYVNEHETIEGAPGLKPEHLAVFDCAFKPMNGERSIHYMGHVRMMSAVQPFLSGAISKTVNMPEAATPQDIEQVYLEGWRLGLKAIAIYRDNSKRSQPLSTGKKKDADERAVEVVASEALATATAELTGRIAELERQLVTAQAEAVKPHRRRLPTERQSVTHKFEVAGHEGYITVGCYPDGAPGEMFIRMAKEGSTVAGLMDSMAIAVSVALQYGVPLRDLVNKFAHVRFEPSGFTGNPEIPIAKSIVDYIFRWLGSRFLPKSEREALGIIDRSGEGEDADGAMSAAVAPVASPAPAGSPGAGGSGSAGATATAGSRAPAAGAPASQKPDEPAAGPATSEASDRPSASAPTATSAPADPPKASAAPGVTSLGRPAGSNGHSASNGAAKSIGMQLGSRQQRVAFQAQADAPSCADCGSIMVRNGSCYKCLNCGSTSGCS